MRAALLPVFALLIAPLSGCLEFLEETTEGEHDDEVRDPPSKETPVEGKMTSTEKRKESVNPCPPGVGVPPPPTKYCGKKFVWIEGAIELASLPVILSTFNGNVKVFAGPDGEWNLTYEVTVQGDTADEARTKINNHLLEWSHSDDGGHFVHAKARYKTNNCQACGGASLSLGLPQDLVLSSDLATSNGNVNADGFRHKTLIASSSNGNVVVAGEFRDAILSTSNGNVQFDGSAFETGSWTFSTSNGNVVVNVPESSQRGYNIQGTTSNGEVSIGLQDGAVKGTTKSFKQFTTTNYDGRSIRTEGVFTSSNGDVDVQKSGAAAIAQAWDAPARQPI